MKDKSRLALKSDKLIRITPFLLIFCILAAIYSNSFHASWHMDDRPNIITNKHLHIDNLMPESLWRTFFSNQGRETPKLFRPLACFTFAVNWYIGQDNVFGYHIVNLGFHLGTATGIYFLFLRLLSLAHKRKEYQYPFIISDVALIAAILWAINPIQTQAVTYIVQRMAVMAAFFYVLSMLYYVKARTSPLVRQKWCYAFLCGVWFLCALGSKENAIMLPISLILIEWIFFQKARTDFFRWPATWIIFAGLFAIIIISVFVVMGATPIETMRSWYGKRPFTFEERLLTQPRIVLGYLSQIFYPVPERFSIAHDVTLSKSLFFPWTTLPAIGAVFAMITYAFSFSKRHPLLSFAILFFFANHIIESTIFPLEIVFEHRNYLPSLFLFLPIAAGICKFMSKLWQNSRPLYAIMATSSIILIVSIGLSTYSRNEVWATGITLWSDAAHKAPNHVRPVVTLGIRLAWQDNPTQSDYDFALALFRHAMTLPDAARKTEKSEILGNIASIYYHRGDNAKAIETYLEALDEDPSFLKNRSDLIKPLIVNGNFDEASRHAAYLINKRPRNPDYLNTKGFVLLWQDKPEVALSYFQRALVHGPPSPSLLMNIGVTLGRLESPDNGQWFLKQSAHKSPQDPIPLLALIENRLNAGDERGASLYADKLVSSHPLTAITHYLSVLENSYNYAPVSVDIISPFLAESIGRETSRLSAKGLSF